MKHEPPNPWDDGSIAPPQPTPRTEGDLSRDSWSYLPVNQEPFPDRTNVERLEKILSFVAGALFGAPAGFGFWVLVVHTNEVAGLAWDTAAWIFIVACALAGGFLLARVKPTLR